MWVCVDFNETFHERLEYGHRRDADDVDGDEWISATETAAEPIATTSHVSSKHTHIMRSVLEMESTTH